MQSNSHLVQRWSQRRAFAPIRRDSPSLLALILATMIAAGCDESFTPIEPSDRQFSVYGYLDASADTQWIRVMPIRPLVLTTPGPLGATVTLEHLGTGRIIELRDSVFRFSQHNPDVGSEGVYIHNFWTAERIEPEASYRFSAQRDGEESSEAVVKIPPDYHLEVWINQSRNAARFDLVRLDGLEHVALVRATAHYYDDCGSEVDQSVFFPVRPGDSGVHMIPISRRANFREGCGTPEVEKRELLVVGSGEEWPSGREYLPSALGVSNIPSNISNSLGFLGGVLTRVVPYETCELGGRPRPDYCQLRYNAASATLLGTLTDGLCGGGVARADVELREISPELPAHPKIRSTRSDRSGGFRISALEAGRQYALKVSHIAYDAQGIPFAAYQDHTDTLQFAPGEQAAYHAELRRLVPCTVQV